LSLSPSGAPTIPVRVNGRLQQLWIDTGSSFTVLASDVAQECKVSPATRDTLAAQGAVARVPAAPAIVASLTLGALEIFNVPAMIIDAANLKLADQERAALARGEVPPKIDGIIGWDVIRRLDIEIDYAHSLVTLRRPVALTGANAPLRNLFWFGIPIVELFTPQGIAVHLLLDTGADETYATPPMLTKVEERPRIGERREINGFGKSTTARGVVLPGVRLLVGGSALRLERTFLYSADYPTLFTLDGTLAGDIGRTGRVRIDMTNGRFDVLPANAPALASDRTLSTVDRVRR
ncbi:MAG TPA: retropepsin-like aspartic protease, partial [Candidatus Elarobacter sp.]|nr:retropepsin-like aspartic protease [Candidatus Elarobacter sp.]